MSTRTDATREFLGDAVKAIGFGLLSLGMGVVHFQIPGLQGGAGDLREIVVIVAAFHLRRWWLLLVVGAITSFATPRDGSSLSTFLLHAGAAPLAWVVARHLQRRVTSPVLLGAAWAAFVAVGYYALTAVPLLMVTGAMVGLNAWSQIVAMYVPVLRSLFFEISTTALVTALYLVNIRQLALRREAQAALSASEARLAGILAAAPVGIALLREGTFIWVNERLAQLMGRAAEVLVGRPPEEFMEPRPGSLLTFDGLLRSTLGGEGASSGEFCLRGGTGPAEILLVHGALMTGEQPPTFALAFLDVTERVRLEQQFRQAQKMEALGQVTGSIAHDFGNLLQAVHLSSFEIGDALDQGESPREYLTQMNHAIDQGRRVIRQLLTFSRNQSSGPQAVDLCELLEHTVPMLQTMVGREIKLTKLQAPGLPRIHADPGQVEQVLLNLVINARDAINANPSSSRSITVAAVPSDSALGEPEGGVVLSVADTGTGMDEATRRRIFEPFFTTKELGKGSGLGLATVFGIVQGHGGRINLTTGLGEGSTFRIFWPSGSAAQASDDDSQVA